MAEIGGGIDMSKIDTSSWKEFRVGDLFEVIRGTSRKMQTLDDGDTPIIAAARNNQGIAGYYNVPVEYSNAITVSCNGAGCGSTYYHDYDFSITGDAAVLESKTDISNDAMQFVASIFDAYFISKYSYEDKCSPEKITEETVLLPAKEIDEPDWEYMESYMKTIMEESEKSLENLRKVEDKKHNIEVKTWKKYKVSDLFDIRPTRNYGLTNAQLFDTTGNVPVIVNLSVNNGIGGYIDKQPLESGGVITFSDTTDANSIFYQENDFIGYSHVQIMTPKSDAWEKYSLLFFMNCFKSKALTMNFNYGNKFRRDIALEMEIYLPADKDGNPDFVEMSERERIYKSLPQPDRRILINPEVDWGEFRIGDLFTKLNLKCKKKDFNKANDVSLMQTEEFTLPLVNAKHDNNGIMYYGREADWDSATMTIDIVGDGAASTGDVYAQPQKTGVLYNAYLVKPLWNYNSEYILQFMACAIEKCVKEHFGYENKCTWDKVRNEKIKLPITIFGEPDWQYMEAYMRNISDKTEQQLKELKGVTNATI